MVEEKREGARRRRDEEAPEMSGFGDEEWGDEEDEDNERWEVDDWDKNGDV